MSHTIRLAIGAAAILLGQVALAQNTGYEYFPLKWTYKVQDQSVEVLVSGIEKYNNEECTRVDTIVNGKVQASELYIVKTDGVYRVKVKDDRIDPPVKVLAIPPKKGDSWEVKSKVGSQIVSGKFVTKEVSDKVVTPKGPFDAVLVEGVDLDVAGTKTTVKVWFAKGVGIVKLTYKIQDAESVLELTNYEEGK
jgi:formylmethanofuran dehydrogenase subunit D